MPDVRVAGHHLMDELGLGFHRLPHIGVKAALSDVTINLNCFILIALPQNPAFALFHVGGTPRRVEMMQRNEAFLHIHSCAHFLRATEQNSLFSRLHFLEQGKFFNITVVILNEGDFFGGNAAFHQLGFQVVVNAKLAAQF